MTCARRRGRCRSLPVLLVLLRRSPATARLEGKLPGKPDPQRACAEPEASRPPRPRLGSADRSDRSGRHAAPGEQARPRADPSGHTSLCGAALLAGAQAPSPPRTPRSCRGASRTSRCSPASPSPPGPGLGPTSAPCLGPSLPLRLHPPPPGPAEQGQ